MSEQNTQPTEYVCPTCGKTHTNEDAAVRPNDATEWQPQCEECAYAAEAEADDDDGDEPDVVA